MKTADQDECVLCCREINIYAIGLCDHPVCYECSARMRVLCETFECPICRSNIPLVIYTYQKQQFSNISKQYSFCDKKYQIIFENGEAQKSFQLLLENKCKECDEVFYTFNKLKEHVRRKHNLHHCELCAENLKIFPFERKVYNRKDLARHKILGDPDETSHRGHPLCEFCDQRYVDSDELFRHLRREHYFCHFCDADGKHQYYEDYDYLKVHFRKEHYLCEEGDCANEQFVGAFRTEIDLKAHKAVQHSKYKSKAEVRQARMLDFEFTFAHHNRPGSSSPRGARGNQHRKQVNEENSREHKSSQQAEIEKINTQSTLEFPYLSEDGENKANHINSVPNTNLNAVTIQSFSRNSIPQRQKKVMTSEDFPALVSTTVSVTSDIGNTPSRKYNVSINRQNIPSRATNVSVQVSQKNVQPRIFSDTFDDDRESDIVQQPTWIAKKKSTSFEDEFPRLAAKKIPAATSTSVVNTTTISTVTQSNVPPTSVAISSSQNSSGDHFIVIKNKPKKKKHNKATDNSDENNVTDEIVKNSSILLNNNFNLIDQEKDKFKKNMIRPSNNKSNYIEQETWQQRASFGQDDFPPLAPSETVRRPPGFNAPKKKNPPPGFNINSNLDTNSTSLNISLSSVARQIVIMDKNKIDNGTSIPYSGGQYILPHNFHNRNKKLVDRIQELLNAKTSVYEEFRTWSGKFRQSEISAADYHSKCLEILGEKEFFDIFPELVSLLPDINKQQELLDVHTKCQNRQNNHGAVPKLKLLSNNKVSVCDICYQVLMDCDYESHILAHQTEHSE